MTRPSDCIYCGAPTGSREHTFPAALGGRRMNKGILCGTCNEGFSGLDAKLSQQLAIINGLLGVRGDHDDGPKGARVPSSEGTLTLDATGQPAYAEPVVLCEQPLDDGRKIVQVRFADERQMQDWVKEQHKAGLMPKQLRREEGTRFVVESLPVEWSFGGPEAFREIGRIALNFLAHRWPELARDPGLRPFKDYVQGTCVLGVDEPRHVWYAELDAPALPDSCFDFGHQVLIAFDAERRIAYGRVRFFSTFDLCVSFGPVAVGTSCAVLYDIDPHADHPPDDLRESTPDTWPSFVEPPTESTKDLSDLLGSRVLALMVRIEDRQWHLGTAGLLDAINGTRALVGIDRIERLRELLRPHLGRVLLLAREVSAEFHRRAQAVDGDAAAAQLVAQGFEQRLAPDPASADGLSKVARASLELGLHGLAEGLAEELNAGALDDARLRLFLAGGPGMHAIGTALIKSIYQALGIRSE
jgi:hypothetical protein